MIKILLVVLFVVCARASEELKIETAPVVMLDQSGTTPLAQMYMGSVSDPIGYIAFNAFLPAMGNVWIRPDDTKGSVLVRIHPTNKAHMRQCAENLPNITYCYDMWYG